MPNKKINLKLVGLDGNAFSLMGAFKKQAQREKWTQEEIKEVLDEAMKGDYVHLVGTLADHCNDPMGKDEQEWEKEQEQDNPCKDVWFAD